jgi:cytoskeletal protein CcmA (bactofilin family)
MRLRTWRFVAACAVAIMLLSLAFAEVGAQSAAGGIRAKFRSGDTVIIPASETVAHDLYVVAGTVRIEGRVEGDLIVAGGTVDVSGAVTGDLFAAGGTVNVSGAVGRHLRVAGGDVSLNGPVQLDVLAGAGTLRVGSGARLNGDLIFSAGQVSLNGAVEGSVLGSAQMYTKGGTVAGTEEVTLTPSQPVVEERQTFGDRVLDQLQRYASIVLVGALLLWAAPGLIESATSRIRERPLPTFGVGVLGVVGFVPGVLALLIAMVLIAVPLGLLGLGRLVAVVVLGTLTGSAAMSLAFAVLLWFVSVVVAGVAIGQFTFERTNLEPAGGRYLALLLGVAGVVVVTAIPYVGWWINATAVAFGLGALIATVWRRVRTRGVIPTAASPAAGA